MIMITIHVYIFRCACARENKQSRWASFGILACHCVLDVCGVLICLLTCIDQMTDSKESTNAVIRVPAVTEEDVFKWTESLRIGDLVVVRTSGSGELITTLFKSIYCPLDGDHCSVHHLRGMSIHLTFISEPFRFSCFIHGNNPSCTYARPPRQFQNGGHRIFQSDQDWIHTFGYFDQSSSTELVCSAFDRSNSFVPKEIRMLVMSYCFVPCSRELKNPIENEETD
jgi:hypothetical protein